MQETWVGLMSQEDPLEKEMATYSSILAWEISWTGISHGKSQRSLAGYSPWGSQKSQTQLSHLNNTTIVSYQIIKNCIFNPQYLNYAVMVL